MASTTFVDGETLIEASWLNDVNAVVYTPGTSTAANIANVPAGNIEAMDVQEALNELDTEKQPLDPTLTALAGWANGTNKVPRTTSTDVVASLDYNESTALSASTTTIPSQTVVKTAIDEVVANSTTATPDTAADYFLFEDATDTTQKKALLSSIMPIKAWVNFDATRNAAGGTDSANTNRFIRASLNVTSVLKNGTGDYTITFTNAFSNTNYCMSSSGGDNGAGTWTYLSERIATARTTTTIRVFTGQNNVPIDTANACAMFIE